MCPPPQLPQKLICYSPWDSRGAQRPDLPEALVRGPAVSTERRVLPPKLMSQMIPLKSKSRGAAAAALLTQENLEHIFGLCWPVEAFP